MNKLTLFACLAFAGWVAITLQGVQTSTARIALDEGKVSATKAAIVGTSCASCHGVDSNNMLPIRRTMNEETFFKWIRGTRAFSGFNSCPIPSAEQVTDGDIKKMYRILYSK